MKNEIYIFKEIIEPLVDEVNSKIWINQKRGKRVHCIYKYGKEQFNGSQKIFENSSLVVLGQNIEKEISEKIKEALNE
ncbi:MAG: hypothetical protein ACQEQE_09830 [Bacillota bacterium]